MTDELPPPPKVSWKRLNKLYRQLFGRLWVYRQQTLGVDELRHVGRACAHILGPVVPELHVQDTLAQYAGLRLTPQLVDQLARQLAARVGDLHAGPLLRTTRIAGEGWHLLEIYQLQPQEQFGKLGRRTKLYVLAGQLAGQYLTPWLHENLLNYLAYQALGFSRRLLYEDEPRLLIGLWCWAYLRENDDQTEIAEWAKSSATEAHNRPILKLRMRFDIDVDQLTEERAQQYSCPNGLDHYCHECHVPVTQCVASPHRDPLLGYAADNQPPRSDSRAGDSGSAARCSASPDVEVRHPTSASGDG